MKAEQGVTVSAGLLHFAMLLCSFSSLLPAFSLPSSCASSREIFSPPPAHPSPCLSQREITHFQQQPGAATGRMLVFHSVPA